MDKAFTGIGGSAGSSNASQRSDPAGKGNLLRNNLKLERKEYTAVISFITESPLCGALGGLSAAGRWIGCYKKKVLF